MLSSAVHRLILALDVPSAPEAEKLIEATDGAVGIYKIGLGLLAGDGIGLARRIVAAGRRVFLDMKLFDIGQTVTDAAARLAETGVHILTVHGDPYVVEAAVRGRDLSGRRDLDIYAVTVLTGVDGADLQRAGFLLPPFDLVLQRAVTARSAGADGVIAAGTECAAVKRSCPELKVITPGIRSAGSPRHDQKRVVTPAEAVAAGADFLVIGREITKAGDPRAAAGRIAEEIATAL